MIKTIFIHTAAVQARMMYDEPISKMVKTIEDWHTLPKPDGRGWSKAGYHYLINQKAERASIVAPETRISNGVKGHNTGSIHICLWGGKGGAETDQITDHYSARQILELKNLLIELKGRYPEAEIRGHNEFAAKACPCFDVQMWLRSWAPEWAADQQHNNPAGKSYPVLRKGSRGAFVLDLQAQLSALNYHVGVIDGSFGTLTVGGVTSFQADHGLVTDGIVGMATWNALGSAKPRVISEARKNTTEADLRAKGSRTIKSADKAEATVKVGGILVAAQEAVSKVEEARAVVDRADGALQGVFGGLQSFAVPILILVGVGLAVYFIKRAKAARVDDDRSGANVGK